jgi:LuxR family transcriptional regulator, maltose regulon positive regulatory protein
MADTRTRPPAGSRLPVAATKFGCPKVPGQAVNRARLVEQLAEPDWQVALVTGGPASGKTVAVAQWFEGLDEVDREWLTLGEEDGLPFRFWMTLTVGLNRAVPGAFVGSEELAADPATPRTVVLNQMLLELSELERELVVVLDDVHLLRDPEQWRDLIALVENLPRHLRLVLTSRSDPPIPIALWSAHAWLVQIRQADLAFTLSETVEFFAALDEQRLTPDDVEALWRHTEGWTAALHLAAVQIRRRADAGAAAREFSGSNRMVTDLLVTEILDVQSEDIAEFMLRTCVLDVLDAELCDAVAKRTDSAQVLRSLEARMPFIAAVDIEEQAYRYHPLLSDVLRGQLSARHPGAAPALARLAAAVVEERGEIVRAVGYLLAAGDNDRAFSLAFEVAFDRFDHNDPSAAAAWVDLLQADSAEASVHSMLTYSISLSLVGRADEGMTWLERAALRIAERPEAYAREAAIVDAIRLGAFSLITGEGDGIGPGRRVVALVDDGVDLGYLGARARPNLARAHLLVDQPREAERVLDEGDMGDMIARLVLGPAVAARVALRLGELTEAEDQASRALAAARTLELDRQTGALDAYIAQVGVLTERNRLREADASLDLLRQICDFHPEAIVYHVLARVDQVRLVVARGGVEEGFTVIDEMRSLIAGHRRPVLERLIDVIAARCHIEAGDLRRAGDLVSALPADSSQGVLLRARLDLAHQRPDATMARLARHDFDNRRDRLVGELLGVRAAAAANDKMVATYVARAVELAAPEGLARLIVEEGQLVSRLARAAAEQLESPHGPELAESLGGPPKAKQVTHPAVVLSDRERAVLRFLPTQLTNQEIARECNMSVNTVKTHVKSLYARLDVSTRSAAVERSRLLGLL